MHPVARVSNVWSAVVKNIAQGWLQNHINGVRLVYTDRNISMLNSKSATNLYLKV
jgi:hypothetical protein